MYIATPCINVLYVRIYCMYVNGKILVLSNRITIRSLAAAKSILDEILIMHLCSYVRIRKARRVVAAMFANNRLRTPKIHSYVCSTI